MNTENRSKAAHEHDHGRIPRWKALLLAVPAFCLIAGCALNSKIPIPIRHYALEYAPPVIEGAAPLEESIKVETLSVVRTYAGSSMVYRSGSFEYSHDAYRRWRVKPSDMITDLLVRDLRRSGLFKGVFSSWDQESGNYVLSGTIEELYESEEPGGSRAVVGLYVTLIDPKAPDGGGRILVQKSYRAVRDMDGKGGPHLTKAASLAMEAVSREIVTDVYREIVKSKKLEVNSEK
jgi:ABC-type uncharacterized transport system auxiliary subunit